MIQYKLIKKYPLSPELWIIVQSSNEFPFEEYFSNGHLRMKLSELTNFPENWQKVEELDYEILSLIGKDRKVVSKANYTFPECFQTLVNYTDTFYIYSVKRISDGEVFTIGDNIDSLNNNPITSIYITKKPFQIKGIWFEYKYGSCSLLMARKVEKNPLFTTEDGVMIFKGDDFFVIETQFDKYRLHKTIGGHFTKERSTRLRFHSKEKAEEYVLLNKPMLSLQDLLNVWGISKEYEAYKTSPLFHSFLELAKSKL